MYVVVAQYYVKAGNDNEVAMIFRDLTSISRAEPGCVMYIVNRSIDDPRKFLIYEQYLDSGAYHAHMETYPFKVDFAVRIMPMLERSELGSYDVIDPE
jgi:autoinducer 2-degrading protein